MNKKHTWLFLRIVFFVFIFLSLSFSVFQLSLHVPLHDWDEAIYAQVAKEWAQKPSFTPFYNGIVWFEKPPIPFMTMGMLMWIFSGAIFPLRLVSAILGTLSAVFVFLLTVKITRQNYAGFLAGSIYLVSSFFIDRSTIINVDIYLTLAWLIYLYSENRALRFISIIGGVGSKSLLGFLPLCVDFFVSLVLKTLTPRKLAQYVLQLVAGSTWYLVMTYRYGNLFIQSHFFDHLISRVTKPIELHFGDKFFYVNKIWGDLSFFTIFAVLGLVIIGVRILHIGKQKEGMNKEYLRLLMSLIFIAGGYLLLLTFSKAKLHWYSMPLIPFVAISAAIAIDSVKNKAPYRVFSLFVALLFIGNLAFFGTRILNAHLETYLVPEKTQLALCMKPLMKPRDSIIYIVSPQERADAHVIEAAQLQIGSSFIYGSAPAFRYYVGSPVQYIYNLSELDTKLSQGTVVVLSAEDANRQEIRNSLYHRMKITSLPDSVCQTSTKLAFRLP